MDEELPSRNEIVGIVDHGLVLQVDGVERVAPWSAILSVNAVMALVDQTIERRIPVFVIGVMDRFDRRIFIVGEPEPMWAPLTSTLPSILPEMAAPEIWRAELAASGMASLYERVGSV